MIQDVFSKLKIALHANEVSPENGYFHTKHFVVLTGKMSQNTSLNKFFVKKIQHPLIRDEYKKKTSSKDFDYFGYRHKYINLFSDLNKSCISSFINLIFNSREKYRNKG